MTIAQYFDYYIDRYTSSINADPNTNQLSLNTDAQDDMNYVYQEIGPHAASELGYTAEDLVASCIYNGTKCDLK